MTRGLPDDDDGLHTAGGRRAAGGDGGARRARWCSGPGLGRTDGAVAFAREAAAALEPPLLIDADGLNAHAGRSGSAVRPNGPNRAHPARGRAGPAARARPGGDRRAHRLACAREAAERSGAVVLLKGDDTHRGRARTARWRSARGGTPALATAGTGDVLSGLIGALLAKGLEPFEAASLGRAGPRAGRIRGRGAPRRRPRDRRRRDRRAARRTARPLDSCAVAKTVGEIMDTEPGDGDPGHRRGGRDRRAARERAARRAGGERRRPAAWAS